MTDAAGRRILILFAHPAFARSRANAALAAAVRDLDGVTFHDLYETYPELDIDVEREQQLLLGHDVVVMQHPFFWYSTPAILKEWQDLVLTHGWAYGSKGHALYGKLLMNALTAGGREQAYASGGNNRYPVRQLLLPFDQTAHLCGMRYLPPFVVHGTHLLSKEALERHGRAYRAVLAGLRDGVLDLEAAEPLPRINADLAAVLPGAKGL